VSRVLLERLVNRRLRNSGTASGRAAEVHDVLLELLAVVYCALEVLPAQKVSAVRVS
jgi:hypothetical protein